MIAKTAMRFTQAVASSTNTHIVPIEMSFTRLEIHLFSSQSRSTGPTTRCCSSQFSNFDELRLKQYRARMQKTVVGQPGTATPIPAETKHKIPPTKNRARTGEYLEWLELAIFTIVGYRTKP